MAISTINIGAAPDDGTGDTARDAFDKVNENFATLWSAHGSVNSGAYISVLHKPDVNVIDAQAKSCVIGGGGESDASTRTIEPGDGNWNEIGGNASYVAGTAHYATICGGYDNRNDQLAGFIGGGGHNLLNYAADHGFIGGGSQNAIVSASDYAAIVAGTQNTIGVTAAAPSSVIGGGYNNDITQGQDCVVTGGRNNTISSSNASGGNTISGGYAGTISGSGAYGTVVGGTTNTISSSGNGNCILGGTSNTISGAAAYGVAVGQANTISANSASMVVGNGNTARNNYELVVGNNNLPLDGCDGAFTFGANGNPWSGSAGDSQAFSFTQSGSTTDNTTVVNLTNRSTTVPTVPLNSAIQGRIMVLGKRTATGSVAGYVCDFIVSRGSSGTIVIEQQNWTTIKDEPTVGAVPVIRASVSTLGVSVVGASSVTMRWTARFDCVLVVA